MQNEFNAKQLTKLSTRGRFGQFGKKVSGHRKDLNFSLFIVNFFVTAICLFSSSYRALLNYYFLKPRRVNHKVDKTKLQNALTSTDFGILRTENT